MLSIVFVVFIALHASSGAKYGLFDGTETTVEKYPHHAKVFGQSMSSWECEGVIIGDSWILTRAWCLSMATSASDITVKVAVGSEKVSVQEYKARAILKHPQYQAKGIIQNYDYGLIHLDGTLKWSDAVQKVKLPKKRLPVGTQVSVAAYNNAGAKASLQEGEMTTINNDKCKPFWTQWTQRLTHQLACLYSQGKTTYCSADDASPVVVDKTVYYLKVRSDPKGCNSNSIPTIMADIVPAVPWITKTTGIKP